VTSRPAILGYARERVLLCGRIVMRLEERTDNMLGRLIKESRAVIDAVAIAQPRTWSDVHARHRRGEEWCCDDRGRVTSPREPSRSLKMS
jgi:hypothetical protein